MWYIYLGAHGTLCVVWCPAIVRLASSVDLGDLSAFGAYAASISASGTPHFSHKSFCARRFLENAEAV